jgi:Ni/Fe-hydrogenase subunit HybB-like protein
MAKEKIHPLWYSEFIPLLFLVSSVFAGLAMVVFEGSISERVFADQISEKDKKARKGIVFSLARISAFSMFIYFFLQVLVFIHGKRWVWLNTPMGYWYLLEMIGFVFVPVIMFIRGYQKSSLLLIRAAAIFAIIGIVLNRLNVSIIAFRWDAAVGYTPSWMEIVISLAIIFAEVWVFRWVVRRMPVLHDPPSWAKNKH